MRRQFDIRNSWLDNSGTPVAGRVKFCSLHTTGLENIYDQFGAPLANPQLTNTIGQLVNQVFLEDDTSYTVFFEKYIGNGDYQSDTEPENWERLYSCDAIAPFVTIDIESSALQLVDTIDALRHLDPRYVEGRGDNDTKLVDLGGYFEVGDKPRVTYVWNPDSHESDNGGSVIKVVTDPYLEGRWELVNDFGSRGIDVRHFGVFGQPTIELATDAMSLRIGAANNYAVSVTQSLYFPCLGNTLTYYHINNQVIHRANFEPNTRVFGNTDTYTTINMEAGADNLSVYSNAEYAAYFTITGSTVRTSWGVNSNRVTFSPSDRLIIDSALTTAYRVFTGLIVECLTDVTYGSFHSCILESYGKLGDYCLFRNCVLEEYMFNPATDWNTVDIDDTDHIAIEDWPTTSVWLKLQNQLTIRAIDLKGRVVDSTCELNWQSQYTISNAVFSGFNSPCTDPVFRNCSGTINLTSVNLASLTVDGCVMAVDFTLNNIASLVANDSNIDFAESKVITNVSMVDSILSNTHGVTITATGMTLSGTTTICDLNVNNLAATNSTLYNVTARYPVIINSSLWGELVQRIYSENVVDFILDRNIWYGPARHVIESLVEGTRVNGKWTNNISYTTVDNPITINMNNMEPLETGHGYTYQNNTGNFLPTTGEFECNFIYDEVEQLTYPASYPSQRPPQGHCLVMWRTLPVAPLPSPSTDFKYQKLPAEILPVPTERDIPVFHIGNSVRWKYDLEYDLVMALDGDNDNRRRYTYNLYVTRLANTPNTKDIWASLPVPLVLPLVDYSSIDCRQVTLICRITKDPYLDV